MKKLLIMSGILSVFVVSLCTVVMATFQPQPKVMPYRGEEWHFDIEEKEDSHIIVVPEDRTEPKVYGNGYIEKTEPEQNKYEIILLGK